MTQAHRPRRIVPEVVQSSAMDCGPASLKAILEGFGISASYGRLREACQTEIDGTSIDTMEEVAKQLGLDAEQVMVPADHLLLDEAELLPALVVVRLPSGATHFVVAWNRIGPMVQVMDPATGRRWQTRRAFLRDLYIHRFPVPAAAWQEWAAGDEFRKPLCARIRALGLQPTRAQALAAEAGTRPGWFPLAALDAATRMVDSLLRSRGLRRGRECEQLLRSTFARALAAQGSDEVVVPDGFWSVRPDGEDDEGEPLLELRGAVLVRLRAADEEDRPHEVPEELRAALDETPRRPLRELWELLRGDGILPPLVYLTALVMAAGSVLVEALLFRGMLDVGRFLGLAEQRAMAVVVVAVVLLGLFCLEIPTRAVALRQGRRLENRLRLAFLAKIPRLGDRFFASRLSSDMAERSHSVHLMRGLPVLMGQLWRTLALLLATTAGIIWLDPATAPIAIGAAAVSIALPLVSYRWLAEQDLRVRTHDGALTRFFLDSLLGLTALRCHAAERAVRREHEMLLVEWARANLGLLRTSVAVEGLVTFSGFVLAAWLLVNHLGRAGESGQVLLLLYWVLSLPELGRELAMITRVIPARRSVALRLLEPLGAPDETLPEEDTANSPAPLDGGAELELKGVTVRAGGHTILEDMDLHVPAGSHVAVIGPSGAGKSSLVGLFLGWHRPSAGTLRVDGAELGQRQLEQLRRHTAWVDPAVRLWNRPFIDNLVYGAEDGSAQPLGDTLEQARLYGVLERLPDGLQTLLGEGGGLVSGGEGQRVRLGRALNRPGTRLAILDEPFRGLDREQRSLLLKEVRRRFADATLLCVTHDIRETLDFDRVIVIEGGRIVEDDLTTTLSARADSAYSKLLAADQEVRDELWADRRWTRLNLEDGSLGSTEEEPA